MKNDTFKKTVGKKERTARIIGIAVCEIFTFITIALLIKEFRPDRLLLAIGTVAMIFIPEVFERIFKCKMSAPIYFVCLFYSICPMLGNCYNLYYTVSWWDKMLHILGGVMFAFVGFFFFEKFIGSGKKLLVMSAVFAVCFSMAISVLWEFCEYGADKLMGMDMQDDVVVDSITSYMLGDDVGVTGTVEGISEVTVNGEKLPVDGYIDIGLNDTMTDMILETLGSVAVALIFIITKGKFAVFEING